MSSSTLHLDPLQEQVSHAQNLLKTDRVQAFKLLNDCFRNGTVPQPALEGSYRGKLIALEVAPVLTQLAQVLAAAWMPWQGKTFNPAENCGDNIFQRSSYGLAHILWPFYRGYREDTPQTFRAFAFRTYLAAGKQDPARQVLKIDYDLASNPAVSVRHVLDELVQIEEGCYLGKAHLKWWWGRWQMVAFFSLQSIRNE